MMSPELIGRTDELELLQELCDTMGIIHIGGRSGVGKTAFVSEFCKDRDHIMFSCRPTGKVRNLKALSELVGKEVTSLQDALDVVSECSEDRRIIVIDNAHRLDGIDDIVVNGNIVLILVSQFFDDAEIVLEPFDLRESGYFFPDCMPREKLLIYAVTGGVPGYMTRFDRNISISDNIERLFFRENGQLYSEPERLLRSMNIREPEGYLSVLTAMSEGTDTINGIMRGSDDKSTSAVVRHLDPLMDKLVVRHVPEGMTRASYRISDNMMRFWLSFVQNHANDIASGRNHIFADIVEDEMEGYLSTVYRETCSKYVDDGYGYTIEEWTEPDEKGTVFSHCSDDDEVCFISCTWSKRPVGKGALQALMEYAGRKAPGKERTFIMFSAGGFKKDMEQISEEQDIDMVPLEGMFW